VSSSSSDFWAQQAKCPDPVAKLVLIILADVCDCENVADLGTGHLAKVTGLAPSAVEKAVRRLVAARLVTPFRGRLLLSVNGPGVFVPMGED
jgi:hypothetical protein